MRKGLICGVGINDADYPTEKKLQRFGPFIKKTYTLVWRCPFFEKWYNMIFRCYSKYERLRGYESCTVCPSWLRFSNFKMWMESQDWEGKVLDKDLLTRNNKIYGPDTCLFVSQAVNKFLVERVYNRGLYKIGVCKPKGGEVFTSNCSDGSGKNIYLGTYKTEQEAHERWVEEKIRQAKILALKESNPLVACALIDRYENYLETK